MQADSAAEQIGEDIEEGTYDPAAVWNALSFSGILLPGEVPLGMALVVTRMATFVEVLPCGLADHPTYMVS